tara:strand:- start:1024 stop:1383 length:360 start_codon:yes stop_codon:yes gene_type:complete
MPETNNYNFEKRLLKEDKYKIRLFQIEILLKIEARYGVEETMQALRAIPGVTVVTVLGSSFDENNKTYRSHCRFKFHPKKDSTTPESYLKKVLLPYIRGTHVPGTRVLRVISSKPERIS